MIFKNKVILITGASAGIGKSLALELSNKKAKLVLLARNEEKLSKLASEIKVNSEVIYHKCDVSNLTEVKESIEKAIKEFGKIDAAILNAGIGYRMAMIDFDFEKTKRLFDTNLFGVLNFFEYLIPLFKEQKAGLIVGISSMADIRGFPGSAAYCASKSALTTYLESARIELRKYNIKIITVRPGFVDTNMIRNNRFKIYFVLDAKAAATKILKGIEKEKRVIQFPFFYVLLSAIVKFIPVRIYDFLSIRRS
jgi:short-subunit dehydrogenase